MADVYSNFPNNGEGILSGGWAVKKSIGNKEVFTATQTIGGKMVFVVADPATGNIIYYPATGNNVYDGGAPLFEYNASTNTTTKLPSANNSNYKDHVDAIESNLNNANYENKQRTIQNLSKIQNSEDASSEAKQQASQQTQNLATAKGYQSTVTAQQLDQANQVSFNAAPITQEELNKAFAGKNVRENYDLNLRYPEDMTPQQDTLKISVLKYRPRQFSASQGSFGFQDRAPGDVIGSATLYIPGGISDNNRVTWGEGKMNALQAIMGELAYKAIMKPSQTTQTAQGGLNALQNALPDAKRGLASFFTEGATGVTGYLQRTEGVVTNPNLELLFNAPTLRPFTFNYRMSPRTPNESTMIKKIIRMFKQSMSVQRTESNLFLKTPNTYKLQFMSGIKEGETEHEFLPKIKECALLSFNVNYTPDGTYSTMYNSSMAAYELTFEFQELEPIYNDDYGNDNASIGF
jgi:hypothetical protein